ncbi:MAG: 16S rRNA (cytosine(967)-C(5))-methyltransferase RsmB [Arenicellales bacterium]
MAARAAAAGVVLDVAYRGVSLDALLADRAALLNGEDRGLFLELSYGALRWFWRCKGVMDRLVDRPLRRRDQVIEALMIVGVYQLDQMRLPPHAAIHTTVESCAALGRAGFRGLVNGVLRNFQRRRDELLDALLPHARDAHPEWLWRVIGEQWPREAQAVIEANNDRPPMMLRVNVRHGSAARYVEELRAQGIEGRAVEGVPSAVILSRPVNVDRLPGFSRGRVSVQDVSAQLLAGLISPCPGHRVLDACAAPGGKLTHILELFPDLEAQAIEVDSKRALRIDENLERLGLSAKVRTADASELDRWWDGRPFDLVVLDVPCSGSGVIRRHPDIKVLRRASDVDGFAATQRHLLDRLWTTVKPGGRMIYVTCSILARENQDQVDDFLKRTPDCDEEPVRLPFGMALARGWQILPERGGGDGFYYASLARRARGERTSSATD